MVQLETEAGGSTDLGRRRPAALRALGDAEPPERVEVGGQAFHREAVLKHDAVAATGLYVAEADTEGRGQGDDAGGRRVICKFNRHAPFLGVPLGWAGRILAQRETRALERLEGIVGLPRHAGPVVCEGQVIEHVTAHWFVPGHPLELDEAVDDGFFPALERTLEQMHKRNFAHVDLNKRENILVTDTGEPTLIDFQIHFALPAKGWGNNPVSRAMLSLFQRSDVYHLLKHQLRLRPDQVPADRRDLDRSRPWWIRLWRKLYWPVRFLRRRLLVILGVRRGAGHAETEIEPEQAFRRK